MTQLLDPDDYFDEGATHYGEYVTGYMRFNPWETAGSTGESATGYLLRTDKICDLHSGYFGAASPPRLIDPVSVTAAAWRSNLASTASGGDRVLCSALWRKFYDDDCTATLTFQLYMLAGAALSDTFRHAGVCVRASGSPTYVDTAGSERIENGDSYWLLLCNNGTLGYKWKLLRVNSGAVTQIATQDVASIDLSRPHTMSLQAVTSGGNVVLTATSSKLSGSMSPIGGPTPVSLFGGAVTDSSGSKITANGRCGFGTFQDFQQSSGAVKSVTLISAFEIYDESSVLQHRDEFVRGSVYQSAAVTVDGNGAVGRNLMCGWTLGLFGVVTRAMHRDAGSDRVTVPAGQFGDSYSTLPATNPYAPWRQAKFNVLNPSASPCVVGINLRGSWLNSAIISGNRYAFKVWNNQAPSSGLWTAQLVFVNTAGTSTTLANNADLSAFALALGTTFTLEMRVRNVGGPDETTGTPEITTLINGTAVPWTNQAGVNVQIQADESVLHVALGATGPWQGSIAGVLLFPGAAATVRFDEWRELASVSGTTSTPVDEMVGIVISSEIGHGAEGTLTMPGDWGVEEISTWRQTRHSYDSDHVVAMLNSTRKRRMWRVRADACTDTERAYLLDFWDDHAGMDLPFGWVEPGGTSVVVRFWSPDLPATLRDIGVTSFAFDILEQFS